MLIRSVLFAAIATGAVAVAAACGGSRVPAPATPYVSESCPIPAGARPYTIVARGDSSLTNQRLLHRVVRAIASEFEPADREKTPRSIGAPPADWHRSSDFDSTFRRGKWRPAADDQAVISLVLHADGRWSAPRLVSSSGSPAVGRAALAAFDSALRFVPNTVTRDTLPRALPLEARRRGADSVAITMHFGDSARAGETAVARYAIHESPVIPVGRSAPSYPTALRNAGMEGEVIVQFIVDSTGTPDLTRFRAREGAHALFVEVVRTAVARQRFTPAQRDCRKVPQLVQQAFTFALRGSPGRTE